MRSLLLAPLLVLTACGDGAFGPKPTTGFVTNQRIMYLDGLHNENTDLIRWKDKTYLVFRGGETAQTNSTRARLKVWESPDAGDTWTLNTEIFMPDRDIRDPKFVIEGDRLVLYACSRVPGNHVRDVLSKAWAVRTETSDGKTFTLPPVQVYDETWEFWRFVRHGSLWYATGYNDGDLEAALFSSPDGIQWQKVSTIYGKADDVPSETELQFFGETAVALVRLDNGVSLLDEGHTAICVAPPPYTSWDCGRVLDKRLDGPNWFQHKGRQFVIARKHLPGQHKRTAAYEILGDLTTTTASITLNELAVLKSSGDTAYVGVMPIVGDQYLVSWYSSITTEDPDWLTGIFSPSNIWLAWLDFSKL
jgi:hypothetical protein